MTREETLKIMSVLRGAYPSFYRGISKQEALDTLNLWTDLFAGDKYELVSAAVMSFVAGDENGYPPNPGKIKAKLRLITGSEEMTEAEAWGYISKAVKNGLYGAEEEFKKLPPILKKIVGSPSQLRDWAAMDSSVVQSVVASNCQRTFRVISQREKEMAKLPANVARLASQLSGNRALEDGYG